MNSLDFYLTHSDTTLIRETSNSVHSHPFLEEWNRSRESRVETKHSLDDLALWLGLSLVASIAGRRLSSFGLREAPSASTDLVALLHTHGSSENRIFTCPESAPSPEFLQTVRAAYEDLPASLQQFLRDKRIRINVVDCLSQVKGVDRAAGMYTTADSQIYVAERFLHEGIWTTWPDYIPHTLRHEIGHAVDHLHEHPTWLTDKSEFVQAYENDLNLLTLARKNGLRRYAAGDHLGRKETFAELFAYSRGNGLDAFTQEFFEQSFQNMM